MSVESLTRVLWLLRKRHPDRDVYSVEELQLCIMHECGTDPRTHKYNWDALIKLKWIKVSIQLTDADITGD